jgi:hypothetical protein
VADYVVDIKPSARRTNGAVGTLVCRDGARRRFETRDDAESWAGDLSERGGRRVWIRRADPDDGSGADAYLVSRRAAEFDLDGAYDKRRRRLRGGDRAEQAGLATYAHD